MRKFKIIIPVIGVVIVLIVLIFFVIDGNRNVVGVLLPTDSISSYMDTRGGMLIAIENLPDDVNFVNIDYTNNDVATAISHAVKSGIRYFVGSLTSSQIEKIKNVLNKSSAILIDSQITNPSILESVRNLYTLSSIDTIQASAIANYVNLSKYRSVLMVRSRENSVYTDYLSSRINFDLKKYGISSEIISTSEIGSVLSKPEAVVLIMPSSDAINTMRKFEGEFGTIPFIGSDWTFNQKLLDFPNVSAGMILTGFANTSIVSSNFENSIKAMGIEIDPTSVLGYNAVMIAYLLAKTRTMPDKVQKYLDSKTFFGANGEIKFKGKHVNSPVYFYKVGIGNFSVIWSGE